jgi:hypothetical protein
MSEPRVDSTIDWQQLADRRFDELLQFAQQRGVEFSRREARQIVAMSLLEDAHRAATMARFIGLPAGIR